MVWCSDVPLFVVCYLHILYRIHLFSYVLAQITNRLITWQQLSAFTYQKWVDDVHLLNFKPGTRTVTKGVTLNLAWLLVPDDLSFSENADLLGFLLTHTPMRMSGVVGVYSVLLMDT